MASRPCILSLDADTLSGVFQRLEYIDLFSVASTCWRLRDAAGPCTRAWQQQCERRWGGSDLNTRLFLQPASQGPSTATNWRQLFVSDNGWADPQLAIGQLGSGEGGGASALAVQSLSSGRAALAWAAEGQLQMTVMGEDHNNGDNSGSLQPGGGEQRHGFLAAGEGGGQPPALITSLAVLDSTTGLLAAGHWQGGIDVCRLPAIERAEVQQAAAVVACWRECSAPVAELHHLPSAGRLAALHDGMDTADIGNRDGLLRVMDLQTGRQLFQAREVLDGYQLAACAPVDEWGHELLGASVKLTDGQQAGLECMRCPAGSPVALCYHRARSSTAALCTFDTRTGGMVQRFATLHRSIYPHLQLARQHFLLTSHAGTPVAVWDRRNMNGPLHEVQRLSMHLEDLPPLPLSPCEHLPLNQALYLHATQDLLLGRGDNGMLWLWDLSERLGWADGSHPGSWLRGAAGSGGRQDGAAVESSSWEDREEAEHEGHVDERDYDRCPLPLGCLPLPEPPAAAEGTGWVPRPAVWVGRSWLAGLFAVYAEEEAGEEGWAANAVCWATLKSSVA